jgi:hypothetical protein
MITVGTDGRFVIEFPQHFGGEEWLNRVRGLINLVKNTDQDMLHKEDVYHALSALEDLMPDERSAIEMFKTLKIERKQKA